MNFEIPSTHETGPKNLAEVDKYLSKLDEKVGPQEAKETHDAAFYKELAKKLREYGIEKIKADIEKSTLITMGFEIVKGDVVPLIPVVTKIFYSSFSTEIKGIQYKINFSNNKEFPKLGWHDKNSNEIFINLPGCKEAFEEDKELAKQYGLNVKLDIYDYVSGVFAHEEHHKKTNWSSRLEEESNAEVEPLKIIGEIYLIGRLETVYDDIIEEDFTSWLNVPPLQDNGDYTETYKRYIQALKNVIKENGKEIEFESAKNSILDRIKSGWVEKEGKKEKKYVEINGQQIRQGYYRDEKGEFKEKEYTSDSHKAFATVLTPDLLKKIIAEYKRLSEVK